MLLPPSYLLGHDVIIFHFIPKAGCTNLLKKTRKVEESLMVIISRVGRYDFCCESSGCSTVLKRKSKGDSIVVD